MSAVTSDVDPSAALPAAEPPASDVPGESRRRGWRRPLVVRMTLFLLPLASLAVLKHRQNVAQVQRDAALPLRTRAHFDRSTQARVRLTSLILSTPQRDFETVRAVVDPRGAADGYRNWSAESYLAGTAIYTFRDPAADGVTIRVSTLDGRVRTAWVDSPPFVDTPLPFWRAGEWARKVGGVVAAMAWLVTLAGAYREPLLRRTLAPAALACALTAAAAWTLEPPPAQRGPGFRVPAGPYAGATLVLLTLPALWLARRPGVPAGHCRHCGYDLTGNQSGVCPECGNPTPARQLRLRRERAGAYAAAFDAPIVLAADDDEDAAEQDAPTAPVAPASDNPNAASAA
jgi:hypothetical protein